MKLRRSSLAIVLFAALAAVALLACIEDSGSTGAPRDSYPTKVVEAPIDAIEIEVRDSQPPQYAVRITSGLPSGCARFEAWELVGREGTEITIRVTNRVPDADDVACTMIYSTHVSTVDLGSDFTPGTTYTVIVNGERATFTAQ